MMDSSPRKPLAPFEVNELLSRGVPKAVRPAIAKFVEHSLGLSKLDAIYRRMPRGLAPGEFAREALNRLGLQWSVTDEDRARIPKDSPTIIVANHPFGGIEGIFLAAFLTQIRLDVRIFVNGVLMRIPELQPLLIPVDPFESNRACQTNAVGAKRAIKWLKQGGALVVFPAGTVSHLQLTQACVQDPPWNESIARIARLTQASIVPIHFEGRNSNLFQLAGLAHPLCRTALLPRELLKKQGSRLSARIGEAIAPKTIEQLKDDAAITAYARLKCYALAPKQSTQEGVVLAGSSATEAPIVAAINPALLAEEVAQLGDARVLARTGELKAYCAKASEVPHVLQEIGRLREVTFRAVGEGTGRSSDIDLFDDYYEHLFLWSETERAVVGAYRLGRADEIVRRFGKRGLYTHTLFELREPLLQRLRPALELGRSFVRQEYQRSFTPLMLLWKGISEYVARHPQYRYLFGAVSISNDYGPASRELLLRYLQKELLDPQLAKLVKGRTPPRRLQSLRGLDRDLLIDNDLEALSALLADLEADGKGVPVLLRQYLKMGGRVLGFNVDAKFGDSIDCLVVVDLANADARLLSKYMGHESAARYLASHVRRRQLAAG